MDKNINDDKKYMEFAFSEAKKALAKKEVPIGAIIIKDNKIIGRGHNLKEKREDPTAHAEIVAIKDAASNLNSWRLDNCEIFVTLEPCPMCVGAMLQARIKRLVFAAYDPKGGAAGSLYNLADDHRFNHSIEIKGGVMEKKSSDMLKNFFKSLRNGNSKK